MKRTFKKTVAAITALCLTLGGASLIPSQTNVMTASAASSLGDLNDDGNVDSLDAVLVLKYYAATLVGNQATIDEDLADVNDDKSIDSNDAVEILVFYASTLAGTITEDFGTYKSHLMVGDGVAIDFIKLEENDYDGYDFIFKVNNYSNVDKVVQIWYIDANGKEIDVICSIDVPANTTLDGTQVDDVDATIRCEYLTEVGLTIDEVEYFTMSFHVADYESSDGSYSGRYLNHWDSENVTLNMK